VRLVLFFILISYPTSFSQIVNQIEINTIRMNTIFTNYSCRRGLSTAQLTVLNSDRLALSYFKGHVFLLDLFILTLNYI